MMSEHYINGGEGEEPTGTFLDSLCVTVAGAGNHNTSAIGSTNNGNRPEQEASLPAAASRQHKQPSHHGGDAATAATPSRSRSFISAVFGQDTHNNVTNLLASVTDAIDGALDGGGRSERERQRAAAHEETRRMEEAMSRAAARAASEGGDVSTFDGESNLDGDNDDDDDMLLDGDVIAIDNLGDLSRIENFSRVPTNLAKPDDGEQQRDALDMQRKSSTPNGKLGLDGTLFEAAHQASPRKSIEQTPSLDGGDKSLVGDDDQEDGRKNKTSNVARQVKHSYNNNDEDDDPAWNVQSVDASFADRASALQKSTSAKKKNTFIGSAPLPPFDDTDNFDEGEEDDTGNDSPTSVTMRKLVREAELIEENNKRKNKKNKNKGGNLIKSRSSRSIKEMFHISSRRSNKSSNGDGQSVQITNILDPALALSHNDDMEDHHADDDSTISNDSPVGTRSRSDSFVAEDRSVELEHIGPGVAPIWSMEMLDMDSEAPSLGDEQTPKMMSDDVLSITDDTNEDADNDGDNDNDATHVSGYTVDNMVPFALDESLIPTSVGLAGDNGAAKKTFNTPNMLNDTYYTAEETADDLGRSNVFDEDNNKSMATQEDYEITLDRYRSDVASMAADVQEAEDCSTVASTASRFGFGAVLGRTRSSSSRGRSLTRGRSLSRGRSLTKSLRSLSRSRSRSRGRGRTSSQGRSSDASMDGDNDVLSAIGFSSTASVGTTSRRSAVTTVTPTATSTAETGSCVGLDQVSSLLDHIYGPSLTRERSELRANKVLQKYQGNEELLLEVLQEKAKTKESPTATGSTASSYEAPLTLTATTSKVITANGRTTVEDCDTESAAEAAAEAIRSIHGSHTPMPLDSGVELVVDFSYEATESVAAASASPTVDSNSLSKKKRNIVSRSIRKVSKKVGSSKTEKAMQAEELEEENSSSWVPPKFPITTNVDATANENPFSNENKAKVVPESANEAPTNYYFQQYRENTDISSVKADSAHVTSHETTSFDDVIQTFDGASTNQDGCSGAGFTTSDLKWNENDDVAFEVDRSLTVRQRSITDENVAPVVIAELAGIDEDSEQYLDSSDMNAPVKSDERLLSSRGTGMSKKSRSKLRLPSFRKQKYAVMESA